MDRFIMKHTIQWFGLAVIIAAHSTGCASNCPKSATNSTGMDSLVCSHSQEWSQLNGIHVSLESGLVATNCFGVQMPAVVVVIPPPHTGPIVSPGPATGDRSHTDMSLIDDATAHAGLK